MQQRLLSAGTSAGLLISTMLTAQAQQPAVDTFVEATHRKALAVLHIEYANGTVASGTAFAVRKDGVLATSAHLLTGPDRAPARRLAVQFTDSRQAWPARILRISRSADLALIKVDNIMGAVPVIPDYAAGDNRIRAGARVTIVGFPAGGQIHDARPNQNPLRRPVGVSGIVTQVRSQHFELLGNGAPGSSGSPVFDQYGVLIGIIFGGRGSGARHTLLATPARTLYLMLYE